MYKRIIAVAAALGMIYGSTLLPAADTGGEPITNAENGTLNADFAVHSAKNEIKNQKTKVNALTTKEKVYGPIRPVEVKNDDRSSESDMGAVAGGEETGIDGTGTGEDEVGTGADPGNEGGNDDGISGTDFDPGDYEPVSSGDNGEAGDYIEETGEDNWEDVNLQLSEEDATFPEEDATINPTDPTTDPTTEPTMEYLGDWTISFYCNCEACCGQWAGGATASGAMPSAWWTAATSGLDFGTIVYVDGLGTFEIQDRGTDYGWLDVFVSDHGEALANGLQTRSVYIVR